MWYMPSLAKNPLNNLLASPGCAHKDPTGWIRPNQVERDKSKTDQEQIKSKRVGKEEAKERK
eukprot:11750867-Karenia_brevis.AAC.1